MTKKMAQVEFDEAELRVLYLLSSVAREHLRDFDEVEEQVLLIGSKAIDALYFQLGKKM